LHRAILLFLLAGLCLSSLDATAKYLVRDHALFVLVWARYTGQTLVVTPFAWHRSCLLVATFCFFGALRYLPLAECSAITFLAPVFVVLLSGPLLGERPTRARWVAALLGFVGILILVRPGSTVFQPAALLPLVAALGNALYLMTTRKLVDENPYTTLFYSALVGSLGLSVALPWEIAQETPGWRELGQFLLLGLLAGVGHWLVISAYNLAPASLLTPLAYLQIVWATSYGYLIFGQLPDRWSGVGMAVVVASGLMLALQERWGGARR
jgi:drug/metabolite transporter (DMT)-like permease